MHRPHPHPAAPGPLGPASGRGPCNVLLMLLDDVGVDQLRAYQQENHYLEPYPYAATPNLDALAAGGLRFRQCRVSPRCSPTRAQVQTGRYAFRTGVGDVIRQEPEANWALQTTERILPELLRPLGYDCAAIGKWHLGNDTVAGAASIPERWKVTPNVAGYPHYAGCLFNLDSPPSLGDRPDYYRWLRVVDGQAAEETTYATTSTADDAVRWLRRAREPWFLYLPWSAIHGPLNWPPAALHSYGPVAPDQLTPDAAPLARNTRARAMLEALDTEIGRVLGALSPAVRARTMVIVLGDNGTDATILKIHPTDLSGPGDPTPPSLAPYQVGRFKNSMYEGGVRVPLFVHGPLVSQPGRAVDPLVDGVDVFRTVLSIAGLPPVGTPRLPRVDGVDLRPLLASPKAGPVREFSFSELFRPTGLPVTGPFADRAREVQRAYVDPAGFKLIVRRALRPDSPALPPTEVYNVFEDPLELEPLPPKDFPQLFEGLEALLATAERGGAPTGPASS